MRVCVRACATTATTMKTDPSAESWSSIPSKGSSSCLEASMPRKFRDEARRAGTMGLNWAMCALCLASLAMSGVLFYRELGLESRIASLEAHCLRIEESSSPVDVLVQRLKSEVQEQLRQTQQFAPVEIFRPKREVSDARCNCPAGKSCPCLEHCLPTTRLVLVDTLLVM